MLKITMITICGYGIFVVLVVDFFQDSPVVKISLHI